jgi:hypothetical protein
MGSARRRFSINHRQELRKAAAADERSGHRNMNYCGPDVCLFDYVGLVFRMRARSMRNSGRPRRLSLPTPKEIITMPLDADLLRWFRRERRYQTRVNAILRAYMQAHKSV